MNDKKFVVRCRAIILHEGKLLVVRHVGADYVALPGGHLEWGEGIKECLSREIVEELGVIPEIGKLLYVNTFIDRNDVQPVGLFFEVKNGRDYLNSEMLDRTHAHELEEIIWASPTDDLNLLPKQLAKDFREGKLLSDEVRFITDQGINLQG
jgi:8-oxo-dGTP diphosphatase